MTHNCTFIRSVHLCCHHVTGWTIKEMDMPDEVNIDDLLDLDTDEERRSSLRVILGSCTSSTEAFIGDLLVKLKGLQKQTLLRKNGLEISNEEQIREHA
ncbi:hypothetical protein GDO81_023505 [Engystomops pustulosus]|uniref:Uncharacterized protein n=1 Tax=Engystomops pustulosus TaxID=76066 RepID=A0AAV6Z949_ENGPU|nr:hypothetical protein GDO81_023505 [Engystomops pustulosus]